LAAIDAGRRWHSCNQSISILEYHVDQSSPIDHCLRSRALVAGGNTVRRPQRIIRGAGRDRGVQLLSTADASKALEVTSVPGKRQMEQSATGCVWSNDPAARDTSRRLVLNTHSVRAFGMAKRGTVANITIEPVSGIGDEAFYQIFPSGSPFIWVRKGNNAISIRILTWDKPRVFTNDQDKAKLAVLAKAAIAKL